MNRRCLFHGAHRLPAVVVFAAWFALPGWAEERTENYAGGAKRRVYSVDADARPHGKYREFYPDGGRKIDTRYVRGLLDGPYSSYHPNGKIKVKAAHRRGKWHGPYTEHTPDGLPFRSATFQHGRLHGAYQQFEKRQLLKDEYWIEGKLVLPKSVQLINRRLESIAKTAVKTVGRIPPANPEVVSAVRDPAAHAEREQALRRLMAYRYLCDLPHEDVQLDWDYVAGAVAAARIMNRWDKLTHSPDNPGWPQADYEFARKGTGSSNISSSPSLMAALKMFIGDSDPGNIDRLGHRRWCLNPQMQRTGFGVFGKYSAMWSFDRSRREVPDFDYVAFPPRGLMPGAMFDGSWAWSVSLDKEKYQPPAKDAVKVRVVPVRLDTRSGSLQHGPAPLALDYFNVNVQSFGINNCIIFRPAGVAITPGSAYSVTINGLRDRQGGSVAVEYVAAFF